jgi:hypothetical protein
MDYLVAYRHHGDMEVFMEVFFYRVTADDAEHAIEQFRSAEPDDKIVVVFVCMV